MIGLFVRQAQVYCDDMLIFNTREEHLVHVTHSGRRAQARDAQADGPGAAAPQAADVTQCQ